MGDMPNLSSKNYEPDLLGLGILIEKTGIERYKITFPAHGLRGDNVYNSLLSASFLLIAIYITISNWPEPFSIVFSSFFSVNLFFMFKNLLVRITRTHVIHLERSQIILKKDDLFSSMELEIPYEEFIEMRLKKYDNRPRLIKGWKLSWDGKTQINGENKQPCIIYRDGIETFCEAYSIKQKAYIVRMLMEKLHPILDHKKEFISERRRH